MICIMHVLCTGNNRVAKDNFPLAMFEMDNKVFIVQSRFVITLSSGGIF